MHNFKILFLFFLSFISLLSKEIEVSETRDFFNLLPSSQVYIDKTKSLTIKDIKNSKIKFEDNKQSLLGYGYSPNFNVWIKFTLKNTTDKKINKILEYDNALTTDIEFYDIKEDKIIKEGLFNIPKDRKSLTPIFNIQLQPNESKTFYIKTSSYVTTLIIKLHLWDKDQFYKNEIIHQLVLALFFGAMFVLAIYNISLFSFTRDISYFYYVLYIFGIIIHHLVYVGMAFTYLTKPEQNIYIVEFSSAIVAFPILALGFFTKSFLQIKHQAVHNLILNFLLISVIVSIGATLFNKDLYPYRNVLPVLLSIYLVFITIYNVIQRNRQAYFILLGWIVIFIAIIVMNLASTGIYNLYLHFPYIIETAFVLEAIIFSVALADRIKQLQKEKNEVNKKLFIQQRYEKERLKDLVDEQTHSLQLALNEKSLLLKELNHRVKNNMQTIVSLMRLQSDEVDDEKLQDIFLTVQNRINAMSHLHELLYQQDNITHINTLEYFDNLIEELKDSYDNNVRIYFDIQAKIKMEQAIYCGLILNELITNSLKYAFDGEEGIIRVSLKKEVNRYKLTISDNGKGYDPNIPKNSLGLILVNTLVKNQLRGEIDMDSINGVKVDIVWSTNEKN